MEYAGLALVAILLASLIRSFLGLAFYIPSESMLPTLKVNDRVVVSRLSYHLHAPHRGDIVVFQNPDYVADDSPNIVERVVRSVFEVVGARQPEDKNLIKRVVGLPGETIAIHDNAVWIDAKKLNEPYLKAFYARGGLLDWEGIGFACIINAHKRSRLKCCCGSNIHYSSGSPLYHCGQK